MTDQLLRFANIVAWATLVFVALRIITIVALTVVEPYTNDATMQRRAGFLVRKRCSSSSRRRGSAPGGCVSDSAESGDYPKPREE